MVTESETKRGSFVRMLIVTLATWGVYLCFLWSRMLVERSDGLYAGWRTVWADWVVHFAYANVFAYRRIGDWFSDNPIFAEKGLDYPFLADALSGLLMRAGLGRPGAFLLPSILASLALVVLLFVFYERLLRSPKLAFLACTLFFTNGGMGFLVFVSQAIDSMGYGAESFQRILEMLSLPPREYTYLPRLHIHWINIVSSELLPQRALLLGMPLALAILISLRKHVETGFREISNAKLCALGVLASVLVVTHMHSFLALVLFCAMLLLFDRDHYAQWTIFAGSAALPSAVLFTTIYGGSGAGGFIDWYPGWLTHAESRDASLLGFLWLNWGTFLPIAAVSVIRFRYFRDPLVLGAVLLFILCFLFRFQPNTWDNTKLLTWCHLLLCVPVARYLAYLWSRPMLVSRLVAVALAVVTIASGSLELWRMTHTERVANRMWSREEMVLADQFRELSSPTARVLCSDDHHHWIPGLAGRPVLLGYRGWLGSYGVDYSGVERDVRTMLSGGAGAESLLARYRVEFAVIGATERRDFDADESYFERHHRLILEGAGYKVFRVVPESGSDRL
jgi:hypothetical protein